MVNDILNELWQSSLNSPLYDCSMDVLRGPDGALPEKLRCLDPCLIEHISNEIMDHDPNVRWDDIGISDACRIFVLHKVVVSFNKILIRTSEIEHNFAK